MLPTNTKEKEEKDVEEDGTGDDMHDTDDENEFDEFIDNVHGDT